MANFLDALTSVFRRPQATAVGDGVTYGPAVSRVTRTPIVFDPTLPKAGEYEPQAQQAGLLDSIMQAVGRQARPGTIVVNPANTNDVGQTVRHESIHALTDNPAMIQQLTSGPAAQRIIGQMPSYLGHAPTESLAYAALDQPGARNGGITQQFAPVDRKAALDEIVQRMSAQYPASTAAQYRALITK